MSAQREVNTTCPYCGVGCGVTADIEADGRISVRGDTEHPSNFGRLCSKGAALGQTVDLHGRLLYPQVHGQRVDWPTAIRAVAENFARIMAKHGPDAVALYVSGQLLTEDYYVANKFAKGFIGTANIDTNSRLCMASSVAGHKRAFGADAVPCCYEDLECAQLIVLVGSNAAWCHPVLYQRIVKAKQDNPALRVVVVDPRRTDTCAAADLHLAIAPGTDVLLFNALLVQLAAGGYVNDLYVNNYTEGLASALDVARSSAETLQDAARRCGLSDAELKTFVHWFANTERVVTVYSQGVNQSSSGSDKVNAIINCHLATGRIGRPGMGPFSFTGQPNAMGGREVGGLANQLAAHMEIENPLHRDVVQRFWKSPSIAQQPGFKAVELFDAIDAGKVKAVWVMATNPVVSLPDADRVKAALQKCEWVVVSDCIAQTDTTALAHVLLPALAWGEKDGTVTNSERRISRQRTFLPSPGEAKPDWWIVCEVAKAMGFENGFAYPSVAAVFREHAALSGFENGGARDFDISSVANVTDTEYEVLAPFQWPRAAGQPTAPARLFGDGRFYTPTRRARFVATIPRAPANGTNDTFPLVLNTGRVRDHWHTMTRTAKAARLAEHSPEPYVEIHPDDAASFGVTENDLARVFTRWGEVIVRVQVSDTQRRGSLFVPMHWNDQYAAQARVDALVNPAVDPVSGQPELKHTPARIAPFVARWYGFMLSRRLVTVTGAAYWVRITGEQFYRYELAGETPVDDWTTWARAHLCAEQSQVEWIEYLDKRGQRYRGVRLVGDQVESCIFVAPTAALPARDWLSGLFAKSNLSAEERQSLLLGKPLTGYKDAGRIVCACFGVGSGKIVEGIETQGLRSVEALGTAFKAGTNCGSCIPELKKLLAQHAPR